jgi:hypothetical protein
VACPTPRSKNSQRPHHPRRHHGRLEAQSQHGVGAVGLLARGGGRLARPARPVAHQAEGRQLLLDQEGHAVGVDAQAEVV